jgi:hypothetical protein
VAGGIRVKRLCGRQDEERRRGGEEEAIRENVDQK